MMPILLDYKLQSLFSGIVLADYGNCWREHRRFALMTLRNFGLGKNSMEERIHGEIQYIVKTLDDSIGKDNPNANTNTEHHLHFYLMAALFFLIRAFTHLGS